MTEIFLVALLQYGNLVMYDNYTTAREACLKSSDIGWRAYPFRATITREGRILSMTPLKCKVDVEVK